MDNAELQASPRKKLKTMHLALDGTMDDVEAPPNEPMPDAPPMDEDGPDTRLSKEAECGITEFVSPNLPGFTGVLKKRYTDFLVNEILPTGEVVHLDNLKGPTRKKNLVDVSATKSEPPGPAPTEDQARPKPTAPLTPEEKSLPEPATPDCRAPDGNIEDVLVPPQTTEVIGHPTQVPPHRRAPEVVTSGQEKTDELAERQSASAEASIRRKEKTVLRQTSEGLVVVGDEKRTILPQDTDRERNESSQQEDYELQQNIANKPTSSSTADWQLYAKLSNGFQLSSGDRDLLISYFDAEVVSSIILLYNRILNSPHRNPKDHGVVKSAVIERETRTKIHQAVRRIFSSRLETTTADDGAMVVSAAVPSGAGRSGWNTKNTARGGGGGRGGGREGGRDNPGGRFQQKGKPGWQDLGGEHLHFSLLKENKDTMEVISYLARSLKTKPQVFQFAGTKDRRGVTVQRVSVFRVFADRMIATGRTLRNAKIGNYDYQPNGLQLGQLTGNEFTITLRDCRFELASGLEDIKQIEKASEVVGIAVKNLSERGFINYYGLQRFGTFSTRTDDVGIKMLQGDFQAAVEAILDFTPESLAAAQDPMSESNDKISRDDKARAYAINSFKATGKSHPAVEEMPKKFSAEANIIRFLGNPQNKNNYLGALQMISRNLRLMYVHAYQSLVWNVAASERWKRFGVQVLEGDLVLVDEHNDKVRDQTNPADEIDVDGEAVVHPEGDDRAATKEEFFTRARALSKEEAESGMYSIFDVVLPTPGYDILYPANEMESFYRDFMGSPRGGRLDPHDMRRKWRDVSLSGNYRKLLARPGKDISFEVKPYSDENAQFVETDLDRLSKSGTGHQNAIMTDDHNDASAQAQEQPALEDGEAGTEAAEGKIAVVLKLQLGSSQYATMALRELMKMGGVKTWKPDYGGGR